MTDTGDMHSSHTQRAPIPKHDINLLMTAQPSLEHVVADGRTWTVRYYAQCDYLASDKLAGCTTSGTKHLRAAGQEERPDAPPLVHAPNGRDSAMMRMNVHDVRCLCVILLSCQVLLRALSSHLNISQSALKRGLRPTISNTTVSRNPWY